MKGLRLIILAFALAFATHLDALSQPEIRQGQTQTWYGRVNRWTLSSKTLKQELDLMQQCGVSGYMIELASWARYEQQPWCDKWLKIVKRKYHSLVRECRKRNLWLFVSIINDNMGKGKYGDTGPALEKVYPYAIELAKIVKRYGNQSVIVQPVAETNTLAGERFEQYCKDLLNDYILVYNGSGGFPRSTAEGFDFRAVHPAHIITTVPNDVLVISDHGLIIRELSEDGGLESKGDPRKVKEWTERLTAQGVAVVGYYAFKYKDFDPDTIKALGQAVR